MSNEKDIVGSMNPVLQPTHELLFKAADIVEKAGDPSLAEALRIRGIAMQQLFDCCKFATTDDGLLVKQVLGLSDIPMPDRASS